MVKRARGLGLKKCIEKDPNHQKKAGKSAGIKARDKKLGMFGMDPEFRSEVSRKVGKKVAKKLNETKYYDPDHPELGEHSAGTLSMMQRRRGLPSGFDNRVKVINDSSE
jgi:general stress protein YciG